MESTQGSFQVLLPTKPFGANKPERKGLGLSNRHYGYKQTMPRRENGPLERCVMSAAPSSINRVSTKRAVEPMIASRKEESRCPKDFRLDLDKVFADVHGECSVFPVRIENVGIRSLTARSEKKVAEQPDGLKTERLVRTLQKMQTQPPESLKSKVISGLQNESSIFRDTHTVWDCPDEKTRFKSSQYWNLHDDPYTCPTLLYKRENRDKKFARLQQNKAAQIQRAKENDLKAELLEQSRLESKRIQRQTYMKSVAKLSEKAGRPRKQCRCSTCHQVVRINRA